MADAVAAAARHRHAVNTMLEDAADVAAAQGLVMALPNGRLLAEARPLLARAGIAPEAAFDEPGTRRLRFSTSDPGLDLVVARAFDVATYVAFGAAQIGIVGEDVLMEFDYDEVYAPLDLGIGKCRISVAAPQEDGGEALDRLSHVRVATKYPRVARRHFARRGIQAEIIKLSGAMELAPALGLCRRIVDLVSSGSTLRANRLTEIEVIAEVSARLIVNRAALKTHHARIQPWLARFGAAIDA